MKRQFVLSAIAIAFSGMPSAFAADTPLPMDHSMHHQHVMDSRISLNLSPEMKQHQLQNMRSHVAAIRTIAGHLANNEFDQAAQVAHSELGLTEEMRKMCTTMSDNADFTKLGLAFHQSGDDLGEALKTKNMKKSLQALQNTMNYCVECHATFRQ